MYRNFFKRLIDLVLGTAGFIILLPIFVIIVILLFISNKGSVFFTQMRPGKSARIFRVIKFKTMNDKRGPNGELLPDADRLTIWGAFVRKTSLDEIPQLLNVIKGDMSLVGPRPLLIEYLPLYNKIQVRRHEVRPGITGWAQVNGRNALSWEQKFEYDVWYINHLSLWLDIKIIWMTFSTVFKSEGISHRGHVTMKKFGGSK